jgi:SecD/SecF fusion protein
LSRYRQLFFFILVLCAVSAWIVATKEMRRGLDLAGGMRVVYEARPGPGQEFNNQTLQTVARILERRVNASGVVEPVVQPKPPRQVIVEIPDVKNKEELATRLSRPTKLEFRYFKNIQSDRNPGAPIRMQVDRENGNEKIVFYDPEGKEVPHSKILADSELILTGADLKDNARGDISGMRSVVRIEFKPEGKEKFAEFTRRHVGDYLAIVLNDQILSVPVINEAILGGKAEISGNFTPEEAQNLANDLNAGALPVPLEIVEQNIVEASLGAQYVSQSVKAGIYGLVLVVIFMIGYYWLPGVIATIALAMYALFTFAILKWMGVTMTLPGLAGFILSVGMAVDANILIFERMKEELRAGKTLHSAIDAGFNRAWTAILDSNVCTIITCLVLIALTSGPVVGFAKTLAIGVLVSMFTAITVSRTLLHLVTSFGFAQNARLYGLGRQWMQPVGGRGFDIIGRRAIWFSISGVIIATGLVLLFMPGGGLKKGIEFTGGNMIQVSLPAGVTAPQVRSALAEFSPRVQLSREAGTNRTTAYIRTKELKPAELDRLREIVTSRFKGAEVVSTSKVGASISREITEKAILAVVLACVAICIYLSVRFAQHGFVEGFKYGACALAALVHDVLVVLGASALFGKLFGWEIDGAYVTAVLTMVGFSVHDTIVVFDRVRENQKNRLKGETFEQMVNRSILQTFARSINTSLTVVLVLVTLLLFGGSVLHHFTAVLLVGIVIGTYSSIFNASPLLVLWERQARKAKGQLTPAEMKPLVERPSREALEMVGASSDGDREEEEDVEARPVAGGAPKAKPRTQQAKRRKRRF